MVGGRDSKDVEARMGGGKHTQTGADGKLRPSQDTDF